jgi:hypothetical protein
VREDDCVRLVTRRIGGRAHDRDSVVHRLARIVILLAALPATIHAENNCSSMMRTTTRFRGTIRSVGTIGSRKNVVPIDDDVRFVVTVDVASVGAENMALQRGQTLNFGVHSPARTFGPGKIAGTTIDLETEWMACDGDFRRFLTLRALPLKRVIENFDGWLEVGHSYRAQAKWEPNFDLTLEKPLYMPVHHDVGVQWMNLDRFPMLTRPGPTRSVIFEVTSVEIRERAKWHWLTMWQLTVIEAR